MKPMMYCALAWSLVLAGCGGSAPLSPGAPLAQGSHSLTSSRWIPTAGESYQIQYDGKLDLSVNAQIYDLDMFDTKASVVSELHGMNRKVMCYISVGTWENWRPDAKEFPKSVLGHKDGHWKGERWLDIRQTSVLEPIMAARLALCKKKGFDGVDPDNLDGYENKTGFKISYAQQLTYDTWVAREAHKLGLTADEKGDNDQVSDLSKVFDYAVTEQCWVQHWCNEFSVYTARNALVVDVEYGVPPATFTSKTCADTAKYAENAILKHLSLNAWIVTCP
ncbi:MAG: endo alpha-1,4 polygalactosaminidase [Candidatus Cybelea sp.]